MKTKSTNMSEICYKYLWLNVIYCEKYIFQCITQISVCKTRDNVTLSYTNSCSNCIVYSDIICLNVVEGVTNLSFDVLHTKAHMFVCKIRGLK